MTPSSVSSRHESTSVPTTSVSDEQVLASVYNFDDFTIRKFVHGKTTIIEASGSYSVALAKEIERFTNHVRGALGLDLHAVSGLQPAILSVLTRIRKRFTGKRRQFLLSDPPERLLDLLKLNELLGHFQIVQSGKAPLSAHVERPATSTGKRTPVNTPRSPTAAPVRKKIEHLTKSLRRTEVLEKGLDSASKCVRRFLPSKPLRSSDTTSPPSDRTWPVNEPDLEDLPDDVREAITVHTASELGEVLAVALRDASYEDGRLLFSGDEPSKVKPLSTHTAA